MRLAVVVNGFPILSETFIFNKVVGLLQAGLDVTIWVHSRHNDADSFADRIGAIQPSRVKPTLLTDRAARLPLALGRTMLLQPVRALKLWFQANALYPARRQAVRAWVLALPLVLGKFDLIHFEYSGLAAVYVDALPLLRPAKLLTSCRGAAEQITPLVRPERAKLLALTFAQLDAIHCVSADMERTVQSFGVRPEQSFVNHPAIDPQQFQAQQSPAIKSSGPYRLLSVSRLHWKKGLEFALLAVRQLLDAGQDVYYHILGGGQEEEKLSFLIHSLDLRGRAILMGRQPSPIVRAELEEADVFLLPSLSEGLSNAVLEAMAMGIPVVSTSAGGMAEVITDGQDGFLVPPMQAAAMADKVALLLKDCGLRRRFGKESRQKVMESFSLQHQIENFIARYQELLKA